MGLARLSVDLQVHLACCALDLALCGSRARVAPTNNSGRPRVQPLILHPPIAAFLLFFTTLTLQAHITSIFYPALFITITSNTIRHTLPYLWVLACQGSSTVTMRTSTIFAPLFLAATGLAQAVEEGIAPDASAPEGCKTTVETPFRIGTLENPSLRRRETAQEVCSSPYSYL